MPPVVRPCKKCGRTCCNATELSTRAQLLGYPEPMRKAVTEAQDACDAYVRTRHLAN